MKKFLFTIGLFFLCITGVSAKEVTVYLFHSNTCPHCKAEIEFLNEYINEHDDVKLKMYEVTQNKENSDLLDKVKETFNCENNYVPYTVIGETGLTGFGDARQEEIVHFIEKYQSVEHRDIVAEVIKTGKAVELEEKEEPSNTNKKTDTTKEVPILGKIDAKKVSLPLVSLIIGFVDGFNPCAMWVLIFLITMLFNMKDRKKMWILGLTFLIVSALVYLLFMLSILQISNYIGSKFRYVIGIVALIGAIINLRSFYKSLKTDDGCQVTNDKQRKNIMKRIQKYVNEKSFIIALLGISLLAISVNFVELACSAGLPAIFTEILSLNNLNPFEYGLYMFLYILMFMIDDIVIFVIAMTSLKITGISNKYTKYSHLIGGILMLIIGVLMIIAPNILMFNF